jgi:tellurite resistance protein
MQTLVKTADLAEAVHPTPPRRPRIPPNLFGICFGLAGLAEAWHVSETVLDTPPVVADALNVLAAVVWIGLIVLYFGQGWRQVLADLRHPVLAPFVALTAITGMLLGAALAGYAFDAGRLVVVVFLALTIAIGGWLTGQWITGALDQDAVHPGYFLPTVAGGLIGAIASTEVQMQTVGEVSFGIGMVCWLLLGSVLLNRLFFRPSLPSALVPTLAIELAPPAVAGIAYSALTGGAVGIVAAGLAGYALLMLVVQVRVVPLYAQLRFGPGFWAFTFSYTAAATDALEWIDRLQPPGAALYAQLVLAAVTVLIAAIAARTGSALLRRQFL